MKPKPELVKQESQLNFDQGPELNPEQAAEYKKIQQILIRMNKLCITTGNFRKLDSLSLF